MFNGLINFIREQYSSNDYISLHEPIFTGREKEFVNETITSTFVSSVGVFVNRFEKSIETYTSSPCAVATVNGTAAIHLALKLAGVLPGDLVITQPLTFVATCNAISYCGAAPIFIDVDRSTLSLSPAALEIWLSENAYLNNNGNCCTKKDNTLIRACLPMHTFGHPADLSGLLDVCKRWHLALVEDAAESLGSFYKGSHTGTFGLLGTISFNGNKIITTGGGGVVLTNKVLGFQAKHLATTAKKPHTFEYIHDQIGYNHRLPNLNAALGCAQLEQIDKFITKKRQLAHRYMDYFSKTDLNFFTEPPHCKSNYWLNAVICNSHDERNNLLKTTNEKGVMTRPIWTLMNDLPMYKKSIKGPLTNAKWLEARVVNLPSSVPT